MKRLLFLLISLFFTLNIVADNFIMEQKLWTASSDQERTSLGQNGLQFYGDIEIINCLEATQNRTFSNGITWHSNSYWKLYGCDIDSKIFDGTRKIAGKDYSNITEAISYNTYVAGTCYVIVQRVDSIKTSQLSLLNQYRGLKGGWTFDKINTRLEEDIQEIKIDLQSNSSLWIYSDSPVHILAIYFEPNQNNLIRFNILKENPIYLIDKNQNNNIFLDFGKDSFGQIELSLSSICETDTIILHLGECSDGDQVNRTPEGSKRYKRIILPLKKGTHSYKPTFDWQVYSNGLNALYMPMEIGEVMPFRYCEIEGYGNDISINDISRQTIFTGFEESNAYFRSNDENLNKVWDLCLHSIKAMSFMGYYIDGDRERCPYEADALINQLSNFACDNDYSISERSIEYLLRNPTWPSEWIMQSIMLAYNHYLFSGDNSILTKYLDLLKAHTLHEFIDTSNGLVTTMGVKSEDERLIGINRNGIIEDIVDWPQSTDEKFNFQFTEYNSVVNAYHYYVCLLMTKIYQALDLNEEYLRMNEYCKLFKDLYNTSFFNFEKKLYRDGIGIDNYSLYSNMFPLCFELVPEEYLTNVVEYVSNYGVACSVYGVQFLLDALYKNKEAARALDIMISEDERSWINMLNSGSTITTEAWSDRIKPNQDWNHAWGTAPANIIQFRLMGIRPTSPGFSSAVIEPQLGNLTYAESILPTIKGDIMVKIHNDENCYSIDYLIPEKIECEIILEKPTEEKYIFRLDGVDREDYQVINNQIHFLTFSGSHIIEVLKVPTNILMNNDTNDNKDKYIDIMGRKYHKPPTAGIYILNGEKIIIKD